MRYLLVENVIEIVSYQSNAVHLRSSFANELKMKLASFLLFLFAFAFAQDDFAAFNGDEVSLP